MDVPPEYDRRRQYRLQLRQLRDRSNPFNNTPDEAFRRLYRLPRALAQDLFLELQNFIEDGRRNTKIPKVICFLTALLFYAQGSYQKSVGVNYQSPMSQPAVSRCIKTITAVIVNHLSGRIIRFPTNIEEITAIKNDFFQMLNFPGTVGAIDGTHIAIVPSVSGRIPPRRVYMNRKGYYSLNCQIICDARLKVLGFNPRHPGSVHDSAIWALSNIFGHCKNRYRGGDRTTGLIGDSGYPLQPFLLTPIPNENPGTAEGRYTRALCRTRNALERCIGVLKSTFRCLLKDRALHYRPTVAAKIAIACVTLNNILRNAGVDINLYEPDSDEEDEDDEDIDDRLLQAGQQIRNTVIREHFL